MRCIKDSHQASKPVQNCKNPSGVMISSLTYTAITLSAFRWNTSPTPTGIRPEFFSNGIKRHTRNASKENEFLQSITFQLPQQN